MAKNLINKKFRTRIEEIWMNEEGIIIIKVLPKKYSYIEDAKRSTQLIKEELSEGEKRLLLIDLSEVKGVSRESFQYYRGKEASSVCQAAAVIKNSPLSNMVANFFMGIYKPSYPIKIFSEKTAAFEWLKEIKLS